MKAQKGFWALGLAALLGILISLAGWLLLGREIQQREQEYRESVNNIQQAHQSGRPITDEEGQQHIEALHKYTGKHLVEKWMNKAETGIIVCGVGLFLWLMAAMGRGIAWAAKHSIERDTAREEEETQNWDPWEEP